MRATPRCSQKVSEYLEELQRREDLELLRLPLQEYDLFPVGADATQAPITIEELKRLVRHWKLHEARGFWKNNPTKEDLVAALLEFIEDHESFLDFEHRRRPTKPTRPAGNRPPSPSVNRRRRKSIDLARYKVDVLKPYRGDLFGNQDTTNGMVYLSRVQNVLDRNRKGKPGGRGAGLGGGVQRSNGLSFLKDTMGHTGYEEVISPADLNAAHVRKKAIATEMYRYSCNAGTEVQMISEGCLDALADIVNSDLALEDEATACYCASALCNLACAEVARVPLIERNAGDVLSKLCTTFAHSADVLLLCAIALVHLSVTSGYEDAIWHSAHAAFVQLSTGPAKNENTIMLAVSAMCNLSPGNERHQLVEAVVPALKALESMMAPPEKAATASSLSAVVSIHVIHNLSLYDVLRVPLTDLGAVPTIRALVGRNFDCGGPITEKKVLLKSQLALTLCSLSFSVESRDRMIHDGAARAIVLLSEEADVATKVTSAHALCNLAANDKATPSLVRNGVVAALVRLADEVGTDSVEAANAIVLGLCELSTAESTLRQLVAQGAHVALLKLTTAPLHKNNEPLRICAFAALCNLLSAKENQDALATAGVFELLEADATHASEKVRVVVAKALGNLATAPAQHKTATVERVVDALAELATRMPNVELQRTCASALASFASLAPSSDDLMMVLVQKKLFDTLDALCGIQDPTVRLATATAVEAVARVPAYHERVLELGLLSALRKLAASNDPGTQERVANALFRLALSPLDEEHSIDINKVLAVLDQRKTDATTTKRLAATMFLLSCQGGVEGEITQSHMHLNGAPKKTKTAKALAADMPTLHRIFAMMRGGKHETQLYAAKALCNLTCQAGAARALLSTKAVSDFIVIAILRTNNDEVKGVSAECLFNLLVAEETRAQMVDESVLWALVKLFRVQNARAQNVGATVLYNLSCDPTKHATVMEIGVTPVLASVARQEAASAKKAAAAALANLSWSPESAAQLVQEGALVVLSELVADAAGKASAADNLENCVVALHNMSQATAAGASATENESAAKLIEDGIIPLMVRLLKSVTLSEPSKADIRELVFVILYNVSLYEPCRLDLAKACIEFLVEALKTASPGSSTGALLLATVYNVSVVPANAATLVAAGVVEVCKAFVMDEDGTDREPAANPQELELCIKVLSSVAWDADGHSSMIEHGAMPALLSMVKKGARASSALSALANFTGQGVYGDLSMAAKAKAKDERSKQYRSKGVISESGDVNTDRVNAMRRERSEAEATKEHGDSDTTLIDNGALALLGVCIGQKGAAGSSNALILMASIALRNLSTGAANAKKMAEAQEEVMPVLEALAATSSDKVAMHIGVCLYNIVNAGVEMAAPVEGASALLTRLFQNAKSEPTRRVTGSALITSHEAQSSVSYTEGSIVALLSLLNENDLDLGAVDLGVVAPKGGREKWRCPEAVRAHFTFVSEALAAGEAVPAGETAAVRSTTVTRKEMKPRWKRNWHDLDDMSALLKDLDHGLTTKSHIEAVPRLSMHHDSSHRVFRKVRFVGTKVEVDAKDDEAAVVLTSHLALDTQGLPEIGSAAFVAANRKGKVHTDAGGLLVGRQAGQ